MADLRELTSDARARWRLIPWWGRVLVVYAATRLVTTGILLAFATVQGQAHGAPTPEYFTFAANWDGQWYWLIAVSGYPAELPLTVAGEVDTNAWAFMPVFPFLAAVFAVIGLPFPVAATLVSLVAGAVAVLLFYVLMRESGLDASQALFAVVLLCTAPVSPMFQVAYAEALGLALLFWALLLVMRRLFWWAIPVIVVASFTRPTGLAFAAFLFFLFVLRIVRRVREPEAHPLPAREFWGMVAAGLTSFAAGFAWAGVAWWVTGSMSAYLDTELAWRAGYVGYGHLVPFQGWLQGLEFWMSFAGLPAGGVLAAGAFALTVVALGVFLMSRWGRRLSVELRLWMAGYALYLLAVFFPQSSTWRLLLPLAPALGAFAVPRHPAFRMLLVLAGIGLQIVWIDWCWWRAPGDWSPP